MSSAIAKYKQIESNEKEFRVNETKKKENASSRFLFILNPGFITML